MPNSDLLPSLSSKLMKTSSPWRPPSWSFRTGLSNAVRPRSPITSAAPWTPSIKMKSSFLVFHNRFGHSFSVGWSWRHSFLTGTSLHCRVGYCACFTPKVLSLGIAPLGGLAAPSRLLNAERNAFAVEANRFKFTKTDLLKLILPEQGKRETVFDCVEQKLALCVTATTDST